MITTKTFKSGNSLAVRLSRQLGFEEAEEVEVFRRGDEVVIRHKATSLKEAFDLLADMPSDFMDDGRDDPESQERAF